ncbi:MAG: effector binding domain-containing protein [Cellulosilyticum sp.]|nr:effector binding domain-containing protein [Cellulosilyticum sp.]
MQYEEVYLEERIVVGLKARTKNSDPTMSETISKLWGKFFENNLYDAISNKVNYSIMGLYDEYESDVNGAYDMTVCVQVSKSDSLPEGCVVKHIPAGKYAKFKIKGHVQKAVMAFWQELWEMNLNRSYRADFEEYTDMLEDEAEITIYIAI